MRHTELITAQCARCIFKMTGKFACVAFPHGIPAEILAGRVDHTKPYDGDGGFSFVPLYPRQVSDHRPGVAASR